MVSSLLTKKDFLIKVYDKGNYKRCFGTPSCTLIAHIATERNEQITPQTRCGTIVRGLDRVWAEIATNDILQVIVFQTTGSLGLCFRGLSFVFVACASQPDSKHGTFRETGGSPSPRQGKVRSIKEFPQVHVVRVNLWTVGRIDIARLSTN